MSIEELRQPSEILKAHPDIAKAWTANDIGYLLRLGLVRGRKFDRTCLVHPEDVVKLFKVRSCI